MSEFIKQISSKTKGTNSKQKIAAPKEMAVEALEMAFQEFPMSNAEWRFLGQVSVFLFLS